MPSYVSPKTKVHIVPKEGEIEITININVTVDGQVTTTAVTTKNADVKGVEKEEEEKCPYIIPDFTSGFKLDFGKKEGGS